MDMQETKKTVMYGYDFTYLNDELLEVIDGAIEDGIDPFNEAMDAFLNKIPSYAKSQFEDYVNDVIEEYMTEV